MPTVDRERREPFRPRSPNVVLVLDVERRCPRDAGDDRERNRPERDRGQDQMPDRIPERLRISLQDRIEDVEVGRVRPFREEVLAARARQPVQLDREDVLQEQAEEEDRDRDPDQRREQARVVEPAPVLLGGEEAEREADDDREEHRRQRELDGSREAVLELVRDRPGRRDAGPEVAVHGRVEVPPVLHVHRLVEAVLVVDACDLLGRGVLAEQCFGRRARQGMNPAEDEDGQPEEDRDEQQQPADDEAKHLVSPPVVCSHLLARPTRSRPSRDPR